MFKWLLDNSLTNRLLVIIASVVLMAYGAFTLSRTPVDVFPDLNKPTVSSGKVMSCSTSSAAIPPASVMMVTVGLLRSGNTSTGVRDSVNAP